MYLTVNLFMTTILRDKRSLEKFFNIEHIIYNSNQIFAEPNKHCVNTLAHKIVHFTIYKQSNLSLSWRVCDDLLHSISRTYAIFIKDLQQLYSDVALKILPLVSSYLKFILLSLFSITLKLQLVKTSSSYSFLQVF